MELKKFIIPLIIFLLGLGLTYIGALLKIIHFEIGFFNGNALLSIATFLKVIAVVYVIIMLIVFYNKK